MTITKVKHHERTRYRVNDPHGPEGKRQRKFFDTREGAEAFVKERTADTKAFGVHMTTISATDRAALAYQLKRLDALGVDTLRRCGLRGEARQDVIPPVPDSRHCCG